MENPTNNQEPSDSQKEIAHGISNAIDNMICLNQVMNDLRNHIILEIEKHGNDIPLENIPNFNEAKFITIGIMEELNELHQLVGNNAYMQRVNSSKKTITQSAFTADRDIFVKNPENSARKINDTIRLINHNICELCNIHDYVFGLTAGTSHNQYKAHGVNPIPNYDNENENDHSR